MRVSYVGNRLDFQTGIFIKKESWDNVQQRVLPINSSIAIANDLNIHLFKMLSDMVIVFREFELRQIIPSPKELREKFQKQSAPQGRPMAESTENGGTINVQQIDNYPPKLKKNEFWKNFDEFVKVNGKLNDWTPATFEKFAALRNHLSEFNKKLSFDKFDENGIADFIDYLGKKGMKNSTINKQLGFLR